MKKVRGIIIVLMIVGLMGAAGLIIVSELNQKDSAVSLDSVPTTRPTEKPSATPVNTPVKEDLKIVAVGDILLGRGVESRLEKGNKDFTYPFMEVADMLKKGDIVFGNLEESITDSTKSLVGINHGGKYVLKNKARAFEGIKYAGFNLLNLANNHILDYYEKGLYDTMDILDKNGIAHAGAGRNMEEARKLAIVDKNGYKVGLLSYTDMSEVLYKGDPPLMFIAGKNKAGVAPTKTEYIMEDVVKARSMVDMLIVSMHWGKEESFDVLDSQRELSHKLLDNGVDIILGHHPHQFHGIEVYKGKPIVYSMGNFIFDQNDPENQESFILNMSYSNKKLISFSAVPIRTVGKSRIVPQTGLDAVGMINREVDLSMNLGSKCIIRDSTIYFDLDS